MADASHGDFEWDEDKAAANVVKHGVTFDDAITVFLDPNMVELGDGSGTDVLAAIGFSGAARVLVVVHVERGERVRIISARRATKAEARIYDNG